MTAKIEKYILPVVLSLVASLVFLWLTGLNAILAMQSMAVLFFALVLATPFVARRVLLLLRFNDRGLVLAVLSVTLILVESALFSMAFKRELTFQQDINGYGQLDIRAPLRVLVEHDLNRISVESVANRHVDHPALGQGEFHLILNVIWERKENQGPLTWLQRTYAGQIYYVVPYRVDIEEAGLEVLTPIVQDFSFAPSSAFLSFMIGYVEIPFMVSHYSLQVKESVQEMVRATLVTN